MDAFLWPLLIFLSLATLSETWKARNPEKEAAATRKLLPQTQDYQLFWGRIPRFDAYLDQQTEPARLARSSRRRAIVYASLALIVLFTLLTRS